jgi:hypothetical protein
MGILRALLAGIKNALTCMWDVFVWAVALPARPFMPKPGRSPLPPAPDVAAAVRSAESSFRTVAGADADANVSRLRNDDHALGHRHGAVAGHHRE